LTTAATIWVNAVIGIAVRVGSYTLALASTLITVGVLGFLPLLESLVAARRGDWGTS
jgi:uncharacterized membrane protein YhiD involved in acid resistance